MRGGGVEQDLRADGGGAGYGDQQVEHRGRALEAQQADGQGGDDEEGHHHPGQVEAVAQPATGDGAEHAAEVQGEQERQAGAQAVAGVGHQFRQPGAERVNHQQAAEERHPEHQGANATAFAEELQHRGALHFHFVQHQFVLVADGSLRVDALEDGAGLLGATLAQQEAHGFRQVPEDQRQQQERYQRGEEHGFPAEARQHVDADASGQHAAHGIAAEHDGNQGAAQFLRRVLVHQRHHVGHQAADTEAGDEATDAELGGRAGKAIEHGEAGEEHEADGDALLAADLVGQGTEGQGAEHHAEQRVTAQGAGFQRGQAPFLHEHRQDHAVDEQVVAIEDEQECAPAHDHPVEGLEARVVDDRVYVDFSHGICLLL
ncbi:hypothetical protein D9M70_373710 [compost metagenome]